jgi:LCP family protein required for cell wall assembly
MLSIPRDLYVYVPGFWMTRINFADMYGELNSYEGGGLGLFNQTLLYNLGISADYYVKVNFDGLIGIVDTLGGVDVPVHCKLEDYWPYPDEAGEYPWLVMQPGIKHMDGELALWYSRSRKTTSVFSREQRQQQVLEGIWRKGKQSNLFETIPSLYEQKSYLVQTDLGIGDMLSLGMVAARLEPVNLSRYNIGRAQVIPYVTEQGGNVFLPVWEAIQPVITNVPPSRRRTAPHRPPSMSKSGTALVTPTGINWQPTAWFMPATFPFWATPMGHSIHKHRSSISAKSPKE